MVMMWGEDSGRITGGGGRQARWQGLGPQGGCRIISKGQEAVRLATETHTGRRRGVGRQGR